MKNKKSKWSNYEFYKKNGYCIFNLFNKSDINLIRKTLIKRFKIIKKRFENKDVPRPSFWSGYKIKPFLIEFWQGRENRLHDRIIYKKINQKKWKKYRLNP